MKVFGLKERSAHKYIKKQLKLDEKSQKKSPAIIRRVGILADTKLFEAYDFTKKLSENFNMHQADIQLVLYQDSEDDTKDLAHDIFNENDFKLNGKIKSKNIQHFADTKFDLLINYCDFDNVYANVLVLRSKALLKAGFDSDETPFYDISIKTQGNKIHTFNEELAKYLHILNLLK